MGHRCPSSAHHSDYTVGNTEEMENHSLHCGNLSVRRPLTEASPAHTVRYSYITCTWSTHRHSVYVSMAVQVPTVPSARARGASMHSMSLVVVDIVALRLLKASL